MEANLIVRLAGSHRLDDTITELAVEFGIPQGSSSGGDYNLQLAREQVAIVLMSVPDVFPPGKSLPDKMTDMTPAQYKVLKDVCLYNPRVDMRTFSSLVQRAITLYDTY